LQPLNQILRPIMIEVGLILRGIFRDIIRLVEHGAFRFRSTNRRLHRISEQSRHVVFLIDVHIVYNPSVSSRFWRNWHICCCERGSIHVDGCLFEAFPVVFPFSTWSLACLRFLKLEASDGLYIQHMGIHVYFVELGYSKSSVQRNQAAHFYLVEEMNHPTAIPSYPKPLLAGSTSFFYWWCYFSDVLVFLSGKQLGLFHPHLVIKRFVNVDSG